MQFMNGEIYGAVQALIKLSEKELPVKIAYWLARLSGKLNEPYKAINTVKNGLVTKYGTATAQGLTIEPEDANWEAFTKDYNELMSEEIELDISPVVIPIILPEKIGGELLSIPFNILVSLEKFVTIEGGI